MSHSPERKEKNCLNCGAMVQGRYCQVCGQENIEPKETFFGMLTHFVNDITHFDGKFFTSLKDLFFKPGFLSAEYMKGRRMSYLNPVRMYVFTSAIFFLVFFSLNNPRDSFKITGNNEIMSRYSRDSLAQLIEKSLREDPGNKNLEKQVELLKDTSIELRPMDLVPYSPDFVIISTLNGNYESRQEYDSLQNTLTPGKKDGWLIGLWNKKAIQINEKYKKDRSLSLEKMVESILHKLPYLLFVSLPFFALILKLLYWRRRKQFYYADHGIFSIHHYILSFILLLFVFLWDKMDDVTGWGIWEVLMGVTLFAWPVYLYLAMKRFYGQKWFKTFVKFILLNITGLILLALLMGFFILFSVFQL